MMPRLAVLLLLALPLAGCGADAEERPAPALDQRQRDSAIGASRLPGAGGVRAALRASDSAAAAAARVDSIATAP